MIGGLAEDRCARGETARKGTGRFNLATPVLHQFSFLTARKNKFPFLNAPFRSSGSSPAASPPSPSHLHRPHTLSPIPIPSQRTQFTATLQLSSCGMDRDKQSSEHSSATQATTMPQSIRHPFSLAHSSHSHQPLLPSTPLFILQHPP